jgi:phage terminase large subunit
MLVSGDYPLKEKLKERYKLVSECRDSIEKRKAALALCKKSVVYWVNNWVSTYDPRIRPALIPFVLFPKQEAYLHWRRERRLNKENGLIEKSRDLGLTWLNVADQTHSWLFETGYAGAFGSRKEILVDRKGDPNSIFEKIRIILRNLPDWMLPPDFSWNEHDNYLRIINPNRQNVITGESGFNCGRGGRSTVYDLDEFAFLERPDQVDAAVSQNTDVVFYTSTPNGIGNLFYKKRHSNKIPVFTIRWQDHPKKDKEWYEKQVLKLDPIVLAQEINIDYAASQEGTYIPAKWVQAAIAYDNMPMIPPIGENVAALDVASAGQNRTVFGARKGNVVYFIKDWQGLNTTQSAYEVRDLMRELGCTHLTYDSDGIGGELANSWVGEDLEFTLYPFHGNGTPTERVWEGEDKTSKQKFRNARAEAAGILRERFRKTYENFHAIKLHPIEELISIPNNPTLIAQLSVPKYKRDASGKILIESKEDMRKRGVESPDHFDFLCYLFAPVENVVEEFEAWLI